MKKLLGACLVAVLLTSCGGSDGADSAASTSTSTAKGATASSSTTTTRDPKPDESAGDALKRQLKYLSDGQFGRQYEEMHPAQKALVDKDTFVDCYTDQIGGIDIKNVEITDTYDEPSSVPGTDLKAQPSTAVTAKITASTGGASQDSTDTYHEFAVDGRWTWTLSDPGPFIDGTCADD